MQGAAKDASAHVTLLEWLATFITAAVVAFVVVRRAITCGLLGDELLFVHAIEEGLPGSLMRAGSSHPPLLRIIVGVIAVPAQSPDWLLRLPSLLFAVGSVFLWQRVLLRLILQRGFRCLLLPAMAWNPFWLEQAFQVLPYSALVFFSSLHCLAWMRFTEAEGKFHRTAVLIISGSILPWVHFFGVNVLVASQFIWLVLLWNRQISIRRYVYTNLSLAILTLPTVPLAVFYIVHDRIYPLIEIADYGSYLVRFSSYCFSKVTLPGIDWRQPYLFVTVYLGITVYVWQHHVRPGRTPSSTDNLRLVAIAFFLAGFTAAQAHSILSLSAIWPRYMLAGTWMHLPLIVVLLTAFQLRRLAWAFSVSCGALALSQFLWIETFTTATDYAPIAHQIQTYQQPGDAFLVQSMDLWHDEDHFDHIWLKRYTHTNIPTVTAGHHRRDALVKGGLSLALVPPKISRVWVYSHLFKEKWLREQRVKGWELSELHRFGGPFPLALFERRLDAAGASVVTSQQSCRF